MDRRLVIVSLSTFLGGLGIGVFAQKGSESLTTRYLQKNFDSACYFGEGKPPSLKLFRLDGRVFDIADFPPDVQSEYYQVALENYMRLAGFSDTLAARTALAIEKDGKTELSKLPSFRNLFQEDVPSETSQREVFERWKAAGQLPKEATFESSRARIEEALFQANLNARVQHQLVANREKSRVVTLAEIPCGEKFSFDPKGFPSWQEFSGKSLAATAPTLLHFMDYGCYGCRAGFAQMERAFELHSPKVRFIHIPVTKESGTLSAALSAAALCAAAKSPESYWKFHKAAVQLEQSQFNTSAGLQAQLQPTVEELTKKAGLQPGTLWTCSQTPEIQERLRQITSALPPGSAPEVRPALFLNQRPLPLRAGMGLAEVLTEIFESRTF